MPYKSKEDDNKLHKERYRSVIDNAIESLGGKCVKCGSTEKLELDHIDPSTKSYSISTIWSQTENFKEELKKCQLLCKDCHLEKTQDDKQEGPKYREHGTWAMYTRGKCRCDECREVHNSYMREYKKKKK